MNGITAQEVAKDIAKQLICAGDNGLTMQQIADNFPTEFFAETLAHAVYVLQSTSCIVDIDGRNYLDSSNAKRVLHDERYWR